LLLLPWLPAAKKKKRLHQPSLHQRPQLHLHRLKQLLLLQLLLLLLLPKPYRLLLLPAPRSNSLRLPESRLLAAFLCAFDAGAGTEGGAAAG
jgi:hypothetical protein